jgi:hypothetical protein
MQYPGTIQFGLNLAVVAKFPVSIEGDLGGDALPSSSPMFLIDFHQHRGLHGPPLASRARWND